MNIETLQNIYINNINNVFKPESFKIIADHNYNVACESFTNRALIYIQNRYATNVRDADAWEILGRRVKDNAVPIGTIKSITTNEYYDSSDNLVSTKDLTPEEFRNAIKLGLITKQPILKDIKCKVCYDIRDTEEAFEIKSGDKAKLKLSSLYNLITDLGLVIKKESDVDTTFDSESMTLTIGDDGVESKLQTCIDALVVGVMNICSVDYDESFVIKEVCRAYTLYSLYSYFGMNTDKIYFECVNDLDQEEFDSTIEILDAIESLIQSNIINIDNSTSLYNIKPDKMARAALLLSILESNYQAHQMRGNK